MALPEDQVTKLMELLKIPSGKRNFQELQDQIQNLIEENDNFKRDNLSKDDNTFEKILNNPGLQHLAENIFDNLKYKDLEICDGINQSSKRILEYQMDKPMFLLRKFRGLSKKNQNDWIKVIESVKNSEKEKAIVSYLQWNLKKEVDLPCKCKKLVDIPCYTSSAVQDDFMEKIQNISSKWWWYYMNSSAEEMEIVKVLAPLTENLNTDILAGFRKKIYESCRNRESSDENTEIVKTLASLIDNPNDPNKDGYTPIYWAARYGHTEIVKILAPLTDNPNAPNNYGETPIHRAALNGHIEIVKILVPLTDNPNAPDIFGRTPINEATLKGHTEIVKILVPLTDNPNAPISNAQTPSSVAKNGEIRES